ncbi:MAG: MBL fold metallo-hydrolase [Ignavibacteriae bacterium]|nr:MBL fold metallo-hydrolase [Ignavibacteriota bacterium]
MKIGKYNLTVLETGTFALDGGAMFGIIPKPLWQKTNLADEKNRITLGARCLLLETDNRKILVDTGLGKNWDEKFNSIYDVNHQNFDLIKSLDKKGINPSQITDVILTHLHFDHTGGSTKIENGKFVPTFQNAKYYVQQKHYDWAINPSDRDKGSFIGHTFQPLVDAGVLYFTKGDSFFDDEIQFLTINGHTIYQQMLKISDSSNTFLFCADLIPTMYHIPIPYVMGYDIQPLETVAEKQKILKSAVDENWKMIFEHDHTNVCATIHKTEKGFNFKEGFTELK